MLETLSQYNARAFAASRAPLAPRAQQRRLERLSARHDRETEEYKRDTTHLAEVERCLPRDAVDYDSERNGEDGADADEERGGEGEAAHEAAVEYCSERRAAAKHGGTRNEGGRGTTKE